jgi:hypothetical protein
VLDAGGGKADRHGLPKLGSVQLDPPFDLVPGAPTKLKKVVTDEGPWNFDQQNAAGQAAVVPPVGVDRRNPLASAPVVHLDDQSVLSLPHLTGDFEVEGRETPFVSPERFAVEVDPRLVVGSAEVDEEPPLGVRLVVEGSPVPDASLVEEEPLALAVPVSRHLEGIGSVEVVLDPIALVAGPAVEEEAVLPGLVAVAVVPRLEGVDDRLPRSVELDRLPVIDVHDQLLGRERSPAQERKEQEEQAAPPRA